MRDKNQISLSRKTLYGIMLLGVFLSALGAGNLPSTRAQEVEPGTPAPVVTQTPIKTPAPPITEMQIAPAAQTNDCFSIEFTVAGGLGDLPTASEPNCHGSLYTRGTVVTLTAHPGKNAYIYRWLGTDDDESIEITNTITLMSNQNVEIHYATYSDPNASVDWGTPGGTAYYPLDDLSEIAAYPDDPRVPVPYTDHNPWNLNVYLELYNDPTAGGTCTGWFIGPHTVITAGHCVYNTVDFPNNNHWANRVRVVPAKNGSQEPYGFAWATGISSTSGWVFSGLAESDYAVVTLPDDTLGNMVGEYHYGYFSDNYLSNLSVVNTAGYPATTPDNSIATQWLSTADSITNMTPDMLNYYFHATGGQSGSAVWYPGSSGPTAISILTQRDCDTAHNNCGVRITKDVALTLRGWGAATEPLTDISDADTTPPTGSWTSPSNGQTISSRSVSLSVNANDNSGGSGVKEVRFSAKWGGTWRGVGTDSSSPYSVGWDMCSSGVPNGDVELGFEVWDNANNKWVYSEHYNNIHINKNYTCTQGNDTTPPTGSWTSPSNGQTISSQNVTLSVNASDNAGGSGVREVRWSAKWNNQWSGIGTDSTAPYSINWDMCAYSVPNGDVELGFEVWDNANNKWVYSEHYTNYHINKNYTCNSSTGGWETWGWQNKYLAGYDNWHGTVTWSNDYPYIWWDFGSGGPFGWGGDEFSLRMQKDVYFPGGYYSFHADHDDGARVYLDGQLIIDAWWDGNGGHDAGRNVSQGYHQVKVEFYENQGDALIHVLWYGPGYPRPDNSPPDGRITSPANHSATSSSPLTITADAWDDVSGVDHVEFYVWYCDGSCSWHLISTDYSSPYSTYWNWSAVSDQHVYLTIHVIDKMGKVRDDPGGYVEVDLDRTKPEVSITSPLDSAVLNSIVTIQVDARDSLSGVEAVQFIAGYSDAAGASLQEIHEPPAPAVMNKNGELVIRGVFAQDYWHEIGWDENGNDGWSFNWDTSGVPEQSGMALFVYAYDKAWNYEGAMRSDVSLFRTPANDDFNSPIQINSNPYYNQQNTYNATSDPDDPALTECNRSPGNATVWYKFIPLSAGYYDINTIGSDYDTMLAVWTGTRGNLNSIACNDDRSNDLQSELIINVKSGVVYYIEIAKYAGTLVTSLSAQSEDKLNVAGDVSALSGGTLNFHISESYQTYLPLAIR